MKLRALSALGCITGAICCSSSANAAPTLTVVSINTTSPFLQANGLQTMVVGLTGLAPGENLQGFIGTSDTPWIISTFGGGGFFNVDSNTYFDGQGQTAASALVATNGQWDSGVISNPITDALGAITTGGATNPIGFAQFGVGQNSGPGNDVFWLSLNPEGIAVPGTVPLFRLTFSMFGFYHIKALLITNTGNGQGSEYVVELAYIPAPGVLMILGVAGVGASGRRRRYVN